MGFLQAPTNPSGWNVRITDIASIPFVPTGTGMACECIHCCPSRRNLVSSWSYQLKYRRNTQQYQRPRYIRKEYGEYQLYFGYEGASELWYGNPLIPGHLAFWVLVTSARCFPWQQDWTRGQVKIFTTLYGVQRTGVVLYTVKQVG